MNADMTYLKLVGDILHYGMPSKDRTGTGTVKLPFQQMRFDLTGNKIPLLTTKKMFTKGIIHEILWYLMGDTNIKYLVDNNVHIWDQWADEKGELGPVYGAQWRKWQQFRHIQLTTNETDGWGVNDVLDYYQPDSPIDQIEQCVTKLRKNPTDRGIVLSAWNVADLPQMRLRPCHCLLQFVSDGTDLYTHLYQRSCDVGLGVPFNIVQYSILTHMFAQVTGLTAKEFVWTGGDVHIYNNHRSALVEQLSRDAYESPTLKLNPAVKEIDDFKFEDFIIENYQSHPTIKMEVSV